MVFENEFSAGIESVFVVTEKGSRLISKVTELCKGLVVYERCTVFCVKCN